MVTVSTKDELKQALNNRESQIRVTGELAKSMRRKTKVKKGAKIGSALMIIGGIVAVPFTGGASAGLTALGVATTALTIGTITISAVELGIMCGFVIGMTGLLMDAKVEFLPDGSVRITPKYKS